MAISVEEHQKKQQKPISDNPVDGEEEEEERDSNGVVDDDDEDEGFEEENGEDEDEEEVTEESRLLSERNKLNNLLHRLSTERVTLRVHDILIKGNSKTKDSLIEAELESIKNATTMQGLIQAAGVANARLQRLEIFDSVNITLDAGPPELPGTANVVVEVVETKNPLTGDIGIFSKPEVLLFVVRSCYPILGFFRFRPS